MGITIILFLYWANWARQLIQRIPTFITRSSKSPPNDLHIMKYDFFNMAIKSSAGIPDCQNNGSCYDGYCSCPYPFRGNSCEIGRSRTYIEHSYCRWDFGTIHQGLSMSHPSLAQALCNLPLQLLSCRYSYSGLACTYML